MPSDYQGFAVSFETSPGVITSVGAGIEVHVYDTSASADSADSPLLTDADGLIADGTLSDVDPATVVHFRVENYNGMAFSVSQTTT